MSLVFPMLIEETTGPRRVIVLQGRSMPYRPVAWSGTQRVNVNWFPGNPVASAQVLGPTYEPTTIRGMWKDLFLFSAPVSSTSVTRALGFQAGGQSSAAILRNFPPLGPVSTPRSQNIVGNTFTSPDSVPGSEGKAQRARVLRDAFELLRRSGQLLRVEWGSIVRFGFLTSAEFNHQREEDIEYEIVFTWIGDTDVQPQIALEPRPDLAGLLQRLLDFLQGLIDSLREQLFIATRFFNTIAARVTLLGTLVTDLIETLQGFVELSLVPAQLQGVVRQQVTQVRLASRDLVTEMRDVPPAIAASTSGNATDVNLAAAFAHAIIVSALQLGASASQIAAQLDLLTESEVIGVFTSPGGVTLRDVAGKFYNGQTDEWRRIAEYNGLATSVLARGVNIRIPRLPGSR